MSTENFKEQLTEYFDQFRRTLADEEGDWVIKGFIDVYKNIYTISLDTKVVSKVIELMLFPVLSRFAAEHDYKMVLSEHQNHYPDITFIMPDGSKIALDIKSTYLTSSTRANGFTLGAFTGYFRKRDTSKNVTFPYGQYATHFVLGIIYGRTSETVDEKKVFGLDELTDISSVLKDFNFLLQEKWRLASTRPGSGNTKNIGSVTGLEDLIHGRGPFSEHGETVFDDYWMNYLTRDMARAIESAVPYRNFEEYLAWRERGRV